MKVLSVYNLSKHYGDKVLFNNISFSISEKEKVGLIGINGTGKSTLLKVIAGLDSADHGTIDHPNNYRVEYLPQNPDFNQNTTVLEQIFYGNSPIIQLFKSYEVALSELQLDPDNPIKQKNLFSLQVQMDAQNAWDANNQARIILSKLGIPDFSLPVNQLSGGQRKRVALAQAFIQPADLLILDEPTNHLDNETIEWLEDYLAKYSGSILLVTHDRYFLNRITNNIFELEQGNLYTYDGNYEYFLEKKAEREQREESSEQKRMNILRREIAWLKRGAKARTTKQKARIDRIEEMKGQKENKDSSTIDITLKSSRLGKKVIEFNDVNKAYGNQIILKSFNYLITPETRLGIVGPNGVGKSTLLQLIAQEIVPDSGEVALGQTVKIAYYKQEQTTFNEEMRVIDYIKESAEVIKTSDGLMISASQMLERFLFSPTMQWTQIGKLSGGERKRLHLLKSLIGEPNVLLLDEPTNDLDIQTLSILEDYIENFNGVVISVSHDRYFLDRTADQLLIFKGEGVMEQFIGNYTEYLEASKIEEKNLQPSSPKESVSVRNDKSNDSQPKKLSYKEQKEWDEIEGVIASLEEKIKEIQREITLAGSDYQKVEQLYLDEKELNQALEQKLERWSELSEIVETIAQNKNHR